MKLQSDASKAKATNLKFHCKQLLFMSKLSNLSVRELPNHTYTPQKPFTSTSVVQTHTGSKAEMAPNCCQAFEIGTCSEEMCRAHVHNFC